MRGHVKGALLRPFTFEAGRVLVGPAVFAGFTAPKMFACVADRRLSKDFEQDVCISAFWSVAD